MKAPVITFYSYKGGVGRTFALANVAALMAKWGHQVLCVDWDLEAPGLHRYFDAWRDPTPRDGLLEWVLAREAGDTPDWRAHVSTIDFERSDVRGRVDLMTAGRFDDTYVRRVQRLDWRRLYTEHGLGNAIEEMRSEWVDAYDYVLIDSRTGITDIGGICAAQLPDILVFLVTASRQSLEGSIDAVQRAQAQRQRLPLSRGGFLTLPLPSRFDSREEYEAGQRWLRTFAEELAPFYQPWLIGGLTPRDALDVLRLPYLSYWSFDERIATLDERLEDPENISYSLAMVTALLVRRMQDCQELLSDRGAIDAIGNKKIVDFFILCTGPDREPAKQLRAHLIARGRRVFLDSEDLRPGAPWDESIQRALVGANAVLVFVSKHWYDSDSWHGVDDFFRAVEVASLRNVPIIPLYLDREVNRGSLPYEIRRLVPVDASDHDWERAVSQIIAAIPSN